MDKQLPHLEKIIPDAYHGTSQENATNIVASQVFIKSQDRDCYLGNGIYFYESSKKSAKEWALDKYDSVGIIRATILLGKCFDLANQEIRDLFKEVRSLMLTKKPECTDASVINYAATHLFDIHTVRGVFIRKKLKKVFPGSRLYTETHIMICVREPANIINIVLDN